MSSLLGTTLSGRYRLESRIGSGGMSTVYRAHDETLERFVAIKLMNREVASDSDQLERFRREARAVARLSHPNIVHVIDAGEDEGRPYIVFEYIDGETLKERIRRLGRLEIPEAVAYCAEIARALGAAHASHVVHRDVKPQNVLIDHDGTAKVTDFGIARTLEEEGLTADGRVLGTTDYVSPEQALGQHVSGQSDLYSLGVVLYEMLTGELPYRGENQVAVAMKHVRESVPDVRLLRPEVSPQLAAVVGRATAKEPSQRYADDTELIADLEDTLALEGADAADAQVTAELDALPPQKRRGAAAKARRRRGAYALALVAALVVAGIVVALALNTGAGGNRRGGGHGATPGAGTLVALSRAYAYNPDATDGTNQNNAQAMYAIDGKPTTYWPTDNYFDRTLAPKPGVGIYVTAAGAVRATELKLTSQTPGFKAIIYATDRKPDGSSFTASGWRPVSSSETVGRSTTFKLQTSSAGYRRYLVWITALQAGAEHAYVNEIQLYR